MYVKHPIWIIPHGSATVLLSSREHLCLTVSFDHDIVDGTPAARFMNDLIEEIKSGRAIIEMLK